MIKRNKRSGRKRVTTKSSFTFNARDNEIFLIVERKLNAKFYPSSIRLIKHLINKAIEEGVIKSEEEKDRVIATISIASSNHLKERSGLRVRTSDVLDGWKKISMGPGNCPPHRCMRRSIISRYDEIKEIFPLVEKVVIEHIKK